MLESIFTALTAILSPWGYLAIFGVATGVLGSITGAGGGFLIVPLLLLAYPADSTKVVTSISLAVVCANSISGSIGHWLLGRHLQISRIDYRTGLMFAAAGAPTAVLGALAAGRVPRGVFDLAFGILLVALALYLLFLARVPARRVRPAKINRLGGALLSSVIGFFSSLLGIGGGFLQVPVMTELLGYPIHVAAATSQFILIFTTATGSLTHVATGEFELGIRRTIALGIGALIGAQVGARLARRVSPRWVARTLAVALLIAGVRLAAG